MPFKMDQIQQNFPHHIAIIMDGNGRWAQRQGKSRLKGHRAGADTVERITKECSRLGIQQLTLYAFSSENWKRPLPEVNGLMNLLSKFLVQKRETFIENNIRFVMIGTKSNFSAQIQATLEELIEITKNNTGLTLCLALSYGGRNEIIDMTKKIAKQVLQGEITIDEIDESLCKKNLYQSDMPELDLLIRTGGEQRISNFLLWVNQFIKKNTLCIM